MATTTSRSRTGGNEKKGRSSATKTTTFSVRLTKEEKGLLKRAAEREDTTATQFLKSAALTKAAHVDNMNTETSFNFDALRDRIISLLYDDFPKEFLAKLTPTADADWKRSLQEFARDFEENLEEEVPVMPSDDETNYAAVTRFEYDVKGFNDAFGGLTSLTQESSGVEFEELSDPSTTTLWLSIDECPDELRDPDHHCHGEPGYSGAPLAAPVIRDQRKPLSPEEARQLRDAVRFGGVEFIKDLLDHALERYELTVNTDSEPAAPDPIDPDKFG